HAPRKPSIQPSTQPSTHPKPPIYHYENTAPPPPPPTSQAMRFVNATTNFSTPTPPDYSQFGNINSNSFSTNEQAMAKLLKVIDHCNQISQFSTQYRDSRMNNQSSWTPVSESHITNMINRTYDILNILI
ncbi:11903_t:CDS:2, partial [Dentiscutata erythropus]